jgi:endonuclease/exonuclease/phosphatase family metal-dependent hydrolase
VEELKAVSLNVWRGARMEELKAFIAKHAPTTHIFSLQEASPETRLALAPSLAEFTSFTYAKPAYGNGKFEMATYVRQGLGATGTRVLFHEDRTTGAALVTDIHQGDKSLRVVNVHGIAYQGDKKTDNPARIRQSRKIIETATGAGPALVIGDFNLGKETQSVQMFSGAGFKDLIDEYGIETTRNENAWGRFPEKQLYADFAFVSPGVEVTNFMVPGDVVSDHQALIAELHVPNLQYPPGAYVHTAGHLALSA